MHQRRRLKLTALQFRILSYLREYFEENDQLPPSRTIQAHFGWRSQTNAVLHLQRIAYKGYLERNAVGKWRFTRLPKP